MPPVVPLMSTTLVSNHHQLGRVCMIVWDVQGGKDVDVPNPIHGWRCVILGNPGTQGERYGVRLGTRSCGCRAGCSTQCPATGSSALYSRPCSHLRGRQQRSTPSRSIRFDAPPRILLLAMQHQRCKLPADPIFWETPYIDTRYCLGSHAVYPCPWLHGDWIK